VARDGVIVGLKFETLFGRPATGTAFAF